MYIKEKPVKVLIGTNEGHQLIGYVIKPKDEFVKSPVMGFISSLDKDGIWLQRKSKITYLSNENIKFIRTATPFDKEIDR